MTTPEVVAALLALAGEVRTVDRDVIVRGLDRFVNDDIENAHMLVMDVAWGYWFSNETPPDHLAPVKDELAARHRALRGAVGRPVDFTPPNRYGHLRG